MRDLKNRAQREWPLVSPSRQKNDETFHGEWPTPQLLGASSSDHQNRSVLAR